MNRQSSAICSPIESCKTVCFYEKKPKWTGGEWTVTS